MIKVVLQITGDSSGIFEHALNRLRDKTSKVEDRENLPV